MIAGKSTPIFMMFRNKVGPWLGCVCTEEGSSPVPEDAPPQLHFYNLQSNPQRTTNQNNMFNATMTLLFALGLRNLTGEPGVSDKCMSYFQELITGQVPIQELEHYVVYSGHGFNQIGQYHSCIEAPNTSYFVSWIEYYQNPLPLYVGLCFTDKCNSSELIEITQITAETLGLPYGFYRVIEPEKVQYSLDWVGYLTVIILGTLLIANVISSIVIYKRRNLKTESIPLKYLEFFSIQKGMSGLETKPNELKYLNGIRCLSFIAVVMGHELYLRFGLSQNYVDIQNQLGKAYFVITISYIFAVDVFFLIGGFLVGLLFLKSYFKKPNFWLFPIAIIQRAFRFWPMYIITILLYWKVIQIFVEGPMGYAVPEYTSTCSDSYYWDLTFFGNFKEKFCLGWTWYLHVDMQMFIVSLIILLVYVLKHRWAKHVSYFLGFGVAIGTIIYVFVECQRHGFRMFGDMNADPQNVADYQLHIYLKPWSRSAAYLLGVFVGVLYYNLQNKATDGWILRRLFRYRIMRLLSTAIGLFWIFFLMFSPYGLLNKTVEWSQLQHSLYLSCGHLLFTFGVVMMVLPFFFGYSNPIRTFLQCEAFQIVAKISFSCYMIHFGILLRQACSISASQYAEPWLIFLYGCQDLVLVLLAGFILCMLVEFPFAFLFDALFLKFFKGVSKSAATRAATTPAAIEPK